MIKANIETVLFEKYNLEWEPIGNLPTVVKSVEDGLKDALEHKSVLELARKNPGAVPAWMFEAVREGHLISLDMSDVALAHVVHWSGGELSMGQQLELAHLKEKATKLKALTESIIASLDGAVRTKVPMKKRALKRRR